MNPRPHKPDSPQSSDSPASPSPRVAHLLLSSASTMAHAVNAKAIVVAIDALPETEIVPHRTILITRDEADEKRIAKLTDPPLAVFTVPEVELDRLGQVKLATVIGLSNRVINLADTVVFLTGPYRGLIDSLVVMTLGSEYELLDTTEQPSIDEHIKRAVFHRILTLALQIGRHGREGKKVGTLFVVGDHKQVLEQSEQMILNPFKGYDEKQRNILDDRMAETVKEFSTIDGAFIVRRNGVIETAGARIKAGLSEGLPPGLGARHAAAAGVTQNTRAIALTVSESDGTVRVWRKGKMVADFEPAGR